MGQRQVPQDPGLSSPVRQFSCQGEGAVSQRLCLVGIMDRSRHGVDRGAGDQRCQLHAPVPALPGQYLHAFVCRHSLLELRVQFERPSQAEVERREIAGFALNPLCQVHGLAVMGDRLRVGVDTSRAIAGLLQVRRDLAEMASFPKMPGQADRDLLRPSLIQLFQRIPDGLVQVGSLRGVEGVVEVLLKQVVTETIAGDASFACPADRAGLDQAMLSGQLAAQHADHGRVLHAAHPGHDFGSEVLPLHAGCKQRAPERGRQAADSLFDDAFHAPGERFPGQSWAFDPTAATVTIDVPLLSQILKRLDREEGMPARVFGQPAPELLVKGVGFGV